MTLEASWVDGVRSGAVRRALVMALALSSAVACADRTTLGVAHTPAQLASVQPARVQSDEVQPAQAPLGELQPAEGPRDVCPVAKELRLARPPQLIEPEARVPEFRLATGSCEIFDSRELVGKKPFMVVFFASWCSVCEHKFPIVQAALRERADELTAVFVSLDEADAWGATEDFLVRHGLLGDSAVAGRDFLGFSFGYNPFRSVPVVVVVGRSGRVVDVQIGVRQGDDERLEHALDIAIDEEPERRLTFVP